MDTKKLRQKILDLAIHGKLVPQDPNDEPASVLLERIRAEKERLIAEGKIKRSKKSATSDTSHYENVPQSWVICKLADVCYFESGYAFSSDDYSRSGTPLIRISNIIDSQISLESCVYINSECDKRFHVKKGDLLIAMSGATTGKMGVYDSNETAFLNQRVGNIKVINENVLLNDYRNIFMYSQIDNILELAYGGAQPNISANIICSLPIPIPSIKEQKRIVTTVDKWFSLIDTLESAKDDLQTSITQAKSKILDLAIHGKLVPQDPNDEPASELLKRFNPKFVPCDNAHDTNQLPDSWCWSTLGDVCSFISGYSYSSSEYKKAGIPLVRISHINDGIISLDNCAYIQPQGERNVYLQKGDILIAMSGATTGKMGIYMNEESAILNQRVGVVRVTDSKIISEKYRDYFLYRKSSDILKLAYGGAQPNISGKMICSLLLPLPPYSEQLRIVAKIEELFSQLEMIEKSLQA